MVIVSVNFSENVTIEEFFQDLCVAQKFVDFVIFTCLSDRGKV